MRYSIYRPFHTACNSSQVCCPLWRMWTGASCSSAVSGFSFLSTATNQDPETACSFPTAMKYIPSLSDALAMECKGRCACYGSIIYIPNLPNGKSIRLDVGAEVYPRPEIREMVPRLLFISTWTDNRWGWPGGGMEKNESPEEAMSREFLEEVGSRVEFTRTDYWCSRYNEDRDNLTHLFIKVTNDEAWFSGVLQGFEKARQREAYVNEVHAVCGLPLYYGGPEDLETACWGNSVFGLAKYLTFHGGVFSVTMGGEQAVRDQVLLVLLYLRLLDRAGIARLLYLSGNPALTLESLLVVEGAEQVVALSPPPGICVNMGSACSVSDSPQLVSSEGAGGGGDEEAAEE